MLTLILSIVFVLVLPLVVQSSTDRCPNCKGKLVDNDYDENIGKIVWTCTKCGEKWLLY